MDVVTTKIEVDSNRVDHTNLAVETMVTIMKTTMVATKTGVGTQMTVPLVKNVLATTASHVKIVPLVKSVLATTVFHVKMVLLVTTASLAKMVPLMKAVTSIPMSPVSKDVVVESLVVGLAPCLTHQSLKIEAKATKKVAMVVNTTVIKTVAVVVDTWTVEVWTEEETVAEECVAVIAANIAVK